MRRVCLLAALIAVVALSLLAQGGIAIAAPEEPASRTLQGRVLDGSESPISEAVVYLKNTKNLTVKTFITEKDGTYRFTALSPNIDYDVHAEFQGRKSDSKTLSSFDGRKLAIINLRIK